VASLAGFAPIGSEEPRILVLGSFPSISSLGKGEYYGHARNQFWVITGLVLGFAPDAPYAERVRRLSLSGIALWDVIASCEREGSLDEAILNETANPVDRFLSERPGIGRLALNGGKAASSFVSRFAPELGPLAIGRPVEWRPAFAPDRIVSVVRLPSTSPVPTRDYRSARDKLPLWAAFLSGAPRSPA
jgi:double-stranded uracil-DNA glycosylase